MTGARDGAGALGPRASVPGSEPSARRTLVVTCGALAREVLAIIRANGLEHMEVTAVPAGLHNRPERIAEAVRAKIRERRGEFDRVLVAYAECGTGGELDRVVAEEGAERIAGPHCYAFYAGQADFAALAEEELGSFYLTDYMVRHFETLIVEGLGLGRHPELRDMYFGNYKRVVYLAQLVEPELELRAREAAAYLGLEYAYRRTGYGELEGFLTAGAA